MRILFWVVGVPLFSVRRSQPVCALRVSEKTDKRMSTHISPLFGECNIKRELNVMYNARGIVLSACKQISHVKHKIYVEYGPESLSNIVAYAISIRLSVFKHTKMSK